jgi:Family of unknown function (DUF6221)
MTQPNADLVAFVRARLAEEEGLARGAGGRGWTCGADGRGEVRDADGGVAFTVQTGRYDAHIAFQDPARTLLRITADRVVLDEYAEAAALDTDTPVLDFASGRAAGLGFAVRNMAAGHSGHPDYRASWLPRFTG